MPDRTSRRPWAWALAGMCALAWIVAVQWLDAPGLLEARASWWRVAVQLPAHLVALVAWWELGPGFRRPLAVGALWALPLMIALPMHSRDAYSYVAQGWLLGHGLSPYEVTSGAAGTVGLLVGIHWHQTTSVYPGFALLVFEGVDALWSPHVLGMIVGLRLVNVAAMALLAWMVAILARRRGVPRHTAWWLGVANPVLLVQWVGGVHNDAVMVAFVAVALVLVQRRGVTALVLGGVALGTATGIKQSAALAGLGLVAVAWQVRLDGHRRGWARLGWTAVVPGLATIVTFLAWSFGSGLGLGWRGARAGNPIGASSNAPMSWIASFGRYHELAPDAVVNTVVTACSMLLVVLVIGALLVWIGPRADRAGKPWLFLVLSLLAFGFVGPALQPWYVTWVIPFFAFVDARRWWRYAWWGLLLAFTALPPLQDAIPPYVAMGVVAVPLAGLAWWWSSTGGRTRSAGPPSALA